MKKVMSVIFVFAVFGLLAYIPKGTLYRYNSWRFERPVSVLYTDGYAKERLAQLKTEITEAKTAGKYSVTQSYRIDEELQMLIYGLHYPEISTEHGFISYGDEAESVRGGMWMAWSLQHLSSETRLRFAGSAQEIATYKQLQNADEKTRRFWFPELERYATNRYFYGLLTDRVFLGVLFIFMLLLARLTAVGWVFRKLLNRQALQAVCQFVILCLSIFACPAAAQQATAKMKKKDKQKNEFVLASEEAKSSASATSPPAKKELSFEVFSDFRHERQEILRLTWPASNRNRFVLLSQNRQAAEGGPAFSLLAAGLTHKVKNVTITSVAGPQFSLDKGRFDQVAAFATISVKTKHSQTVLINRLSWSPGSEAPFVDRHVLITNISPMPNWLALEGEVRRTRNGVDENFWGPLLKIGGVFRKGVVKRTLGELYAYPYFDLVRKNWDLRFGLSLSFAW